MESQLVIVLASGGTIVTSEDLSAVHKRLQGSPPDGFLTFTDTKGLEHWVNRAQIVEVHERGDRSAYIS